MTIHHTRNVLVALIVLLSACAKQEQAVSPTATLPPPTETRILPTGLPAEIPAAIPAELPTSADPVIFGTIAKSEVNPLVSKIHEVIFIKVMDGFIASGDIIEYQIISSEVFPSSDGFLLAEIYYNVRTTDTSWLADGGRQGGDNWIANKCNRFDFVNTEAEFQLKNCRSCN